MAVSLKPRSCRFALLALQSSRMVSGSSGKVGFIGLGNMGAHMARNIAKAGYPVLVNDVSKAAMDSVAEATPASVAGLAAECNTIITMLPGNDHVRTVYEEILSEIKPGALLIDSSTIDPTVTREVAAAAAEKKACLVDAPVSGGVGGAEAGTLTFMVGGSDEVFERATPILKLMGQNIVHCGATGTGQVAKLCNNHILGVSMIAVCEAMNMGEKLGMDPHVLAGILNTSTARCWSSDTYNPYPGVIQGVPSSRDYAGGFGASLMQKDMGLAQSAAASASAPAPLGAAALAMYEAMSAAGMGGLDFSGMLKLLQEKPETFDK